MKQYYVFANTLTRRSGLGLTVQYKQNKNKGTKQKHIKPVCGVALHCIVKKDPSQHVLQHNKIVLISYRRSSTHLSHNVVRFGVVIMLGFCKKNTTYLFKCKSNFPG